MIILKIAVREFALAIVHDKKEFLEIIDVLPLEAKLTRTGFMQLSYHCSTMIFQLGQSFLQLHHILSANVLIKILHAIHFPERERVQFMGGYVINMHGF